MHVNLNPEGLEVELNASCQSSQWIKKMKNRQQLGNRTGLGRVELGKI